MASILNVDKIRATGSTTDGRHDVNSDGKLPYPKFRVLWLDNTVART